MQIQIFLLKFLQIFCRHNVCVGWHERELYVAHISLLFLAIAKNGSFEL